MVEYIALSSSLVDKLSQHGIDKPVLSPEEATEPSEYMFVRFHASSLSIGISPHVLTLFVISIERRHTDLLDFISNSCGANSNITLLHSQDTQDIATNLHLHLLASRIETIQTESYCEAIDVIRMLCSKESVGKPCAIKPKKPPKSVFHCIPGIGPVKAAKLSAQFSTMKELLKCLAHSEDKVAKIIGKSSVSILMQLFPAAQPP